MRKITFTTVFEITDAEYELVQSLYNLPEPKKVTAVKFIKNQYNIALKQAKDICDKLVEDNKNNTEAVSHGTIPIFGFRGDNPDR